MSHPLRRHIEEIVPLTDEEFAFVLAHFEEEKFKKGQFIIREDEPVPYAYFVVSGLLKLVYTDESAKEHILSFAMEDWWESDYRAFFNQTKATLSLQCLEDTVVYRQTLDSYWKLSAGMKKMESFLLQKVNMGFLSSQQRIMYLLSTNVKERYEQLLKKYPALSQRVSKTQLAAYLGVSRETLSRLYRNR